MRVTISSIAALDGAQISTFPDIEASNIEMIPVIVCVLPVPGYINMILRKAYRSLNKFDGFLIHQCNIMHRFQLTLIETLPMLGDEVKHPC